MKKLFCFISIFVCGCSSIEVFQPSGIHEIPEMSDSKAARSFDFGFNQGLKYEGTSDASRRPLTWDPKASRSNSSYARLRMPLPNSRVEFATGVYLYGALASMKYQFWGPHASNAKKNDTSLAAIVQISGGSGGKKSGDQNGTFGSGGNPWEGEMSSTQTASTVVFGWRMADSVLFYFGPYASQGNFYGKVKHSESTDGKDPGAEYSFGDVYSRTGAAAGFYFNVSKLISLHIEGTYLDSRFREKVSLDPDTSIGGVMRFDF